MKFQAGSAFAFNKAVKPISIQPEKFNNLGNLETMAVKMTIFRHKILIFSSFFFFRL